MAVATEQLFYTDAYLREFQARVVATVAAGEGLGDPATETRAAVALDKTAFYPGGGGQPWDEGFLTAGGSNWLTTRVRREGALIWHELEGQAPPPPPGTLVIGQLNWSRRYQLMRTHTGLHILCGVVWRDYGASVTGGNMEPLRGRMDFEFESMRHELVAQIEEKINLEVAAGRSISSRILPRDEAFLIPDLIRTKVNLLPEGIREIRVVEIEGLDLQADGGTHVRNSSEVGRLRITGYKSKGRSNKRIELALEEL